MRRNIIWGFVAVALIAIPAVIGVVALRGDGRSTAALVQEGSAGAAYQLTAAGITPAGDAIEVLSYGWGVTNPGGLPASGAGAGKANFGNFEFTKKIDETSPKFVSAAAKGTAIPTVVLKLFRAGSTSPQAYATYTLTDAYVASVHHSGASDSVPTESISFVYAQLKVEVSGMDSKGMPTNPSEFNWDVVENVEKN